MEESEIWNTDRTFTRNYSMFGLFVIVVICLLWFLENLTISIVIFFLLFIFFSSEFSLHQKIKSVLSNPEKRFNYKRMFIISFGFIFLSIINFLMLINYFNFNALNSFNFISTYLKSLLVSMFLFSLFLSFKYFMIGSKFISVLNIKRGIFAIFHRIIVIIRAIIVTKYWLYFFEDSNNIKFIDIWNEKESLITKIYLVAKLIFLLQMIWDFDGARKAFLNSYSLLYSSISDLNTKCMICNKKSKNQIKLKCNHIFCLKCINEHLNESSFCPICLQEPISNLHYAVFDGYVSFSAIFSCF